MNIDLIKKVMRGEMLTVEDIEMELYDTCDSVHASCDSSCPVYEYAYKGDKGCACFKNGRRMYQVIMKHLHE